MIEEPKVERVLAWLIRKGSVDPAAIEEAVTSAINMRLGQNITLDGDGETMRRVFVHAQVQRLAK